MKWNAFSSFKKVMTVLVNSKRLCNAECDSNLRELKTFVNSMQTNEDFTSYRSDTRCRKPDYEKSWPVITQLLLLSHGQATVERSFGIKKGVITTNLSAQTQVARRAIIDHAHQVGGMHNMVITSKMLQSVQTAYSLYKHDIEQKQQ